MKKLTTILILIVMAINIPAQKKIGLALSGGGALGLAHLGAIQSLEEHGISPQFVAGTSMGAIIGVLYANGYTSEFIMKFIEEERLYRLRNLVKMQSALYHQGISKNKTLYKELLRLIPHNSFDSLVRGFTVCVTNMDKGESYYKSDGNKLIRYVVASSSVPAAFEPVIIDSVRYSDGGLLDNLPSRELRKNGCDYIIGIDVLPFVSHFETKNSIEMGALALRLMQHSNSIPGRKECDWLVDVYALKKYNELDFKFYKEIFQYGYDAMNNYIKQHPEMLKSLK